MKLPALKIFWIFVMVLTIGISNSCSEDDGQISCNPQYNVFASINLALPLYSELQNPNGWAYIQGEGAGTRGIIVVNTGQGFRAYDRNAPHICPNTQSTIEVRDAIKMYCPHDGAEWILLTGQPIQNSEGFAPDRTPRVYQTSFQGGILEIFN
ncbi:Rieske (2Fe-2S) protein [Moheibacter sediminis]|uniref:Ferredoxin subunit of nitrite reductase or a ring-hydroxylating dioxygenase n=1 Tax=Moheibacter sediminis TaxID=1434700 RepID=A0A1W2BPH2_9FLAO|nr:hypothetical protein [Moheibacter sediminis]SMC74827.1 hypothetical protein SAMN06296427_10723 [Moheibacter sediminis]